MHIKGSKIGLVSKQRCKHVVVAALGSNMASRLASLVGFINTCIGSQKNVDNLLSATCRSDDESWRPKITRQWRIDINQTATKLTA